MSNIIPFNFHGHSVRVLDINDEPMFVAKDVAVILGYTNPQKAVRDHCKTRTPLGGIGVNDSVPLDPQTIIIPERDVYRLVMRSKLPAAESFEEWVVAEVLPSIRKTGNYGVQQIDFTNPQQVAGLLAQSLERVQQQEKKIEEDRPKVEFHDKVAVAPDAISIGDAAKIIGTGRNRLLSFLRKNGWVTRKNEPYQAKIESGRMDVKLSPWEHPTQGLQRSVTPLITGKGLAELQQEYGGVA